MPSLLVRPARPADADAIARVHVDTWRQAYPGVGFVSAGRAREEPEGTGEIHAIYVLPRAWGLGAGRGLMHAALGFLRDAGHTDAVLWVLTDNARSRRFYEQLGLMPDGGTSAEPVGGAAVGHVRYRTALREQA